MVADFTIRNRKNRNSLKNFEKDLIGQQLLFLDEKYKHDDKLDLESFIFNFLRLFNGRHNTVYNYKKVITIHTSAGRRRSAGDIFRICKSYYPDCTFIEVLKCLDILCNKKTGIGSSICYGIYKRVYRYSNYYIGSSMQNISDKNTKDEFGKIPGYYLKS